jgi:seryl-tRNA synthetase
MLELNFIRENPQEVKRGIKKRGYNPEIVDRVLKVDETRRQLIGEIEKLRAERNKLGPKDIEKGRKIKEILQKLEPDLQVVEEELKNLLYEIPNLPSVDTPLGESEADNLELRVWLPGKGYLAKEKIGRGWKSAEFMPRFEGKDHVELGETLDILDIKQAGKVAGSRFVYLKKEAVILQFAIFEFLKDRLLKEKFMPMVVPLLVKDWVLYGTSHFPQGKDQVYKIKEENVEGKESLNLVGSSEPPLFAYFADRLLKEEDLPIKVMAYTSCFRSEAGSWGKDVRGMKRVHQFDKLEIDVVCAPWQSEEILEYLVGINEWFLQSLKLPYRVWQKCSADMGYHASAKQYDVEVWLPVSGEYMETMSATNTTDYQARRMNIKFINKDREKQFCHTVNDTGVAMGRILVAILENYQQKDGSVLVPEVLQNYCGLVKIYPKK